MEIVYEVVESDYGVCVKMTQGDVISYIPLDPANSDYQAYLTQLEETK